MQWFRLESFGRVSLQGRKITTLHSTLPAAQETRWNDLISGPIHVASRQENQVEWPHFLSTPRGQPAGKPGGMTSLPVPSTWPTTGKPGGMTSLPVPSTWPTAGKPGGMTSFPVPSTWTAGTKNNRMTSLQQVGIASLPFLCQVASWAGNKVTWHHFLSTPRDQPGGNQGQMSWLPVQKKTASFHRKCIKLSSTLLYLFLLWSYVTSTRIYNTRYTRTFFYNLQ